MVVHGTEVSVVLKKRSGGVAAPVRALRTEKALRDFYRRALEAARKKKSLSVSYAVPVAHGPGLGAIAHAKILAQEIFRVLHEHTAPLCTITVAVKDRSVYAVFKRHCLGYLDYIAHKLRSPFLTVDAIIEVEKKIVVIKRTNPPFGWALPGGFVDYGESLEEAVRREAKEETNLSLTGLKQFHTYSQPGRDPRFHTVGTVFIARAKGKPKAGDDAAEVRIINPAESDRLELAFDHKKILRDYRDGLR